MKNRKGFTLVEILAVIAILGVLALISIPTIDAVIRSSRDSALAEQKQIILDGAKAWAAKNVMKLPINDNEYVTISIGELKKAGYVEMHIMNPKNEKCFGNDNEIVIKRVKNDYIYSFEDENDIVYTEPIDSSYCPVD